MQQLSIGTEKVYGHTIFLISPGQNISPSLNKPCSYTSDMPMGVFL